MKHRKLTWAKHGGKKALERAVAITNRTCDEALMSLFRVAYIMVKEMITFHKFPSLCDLLVVCKAIMIEKLYYDEKTCADMVFAIFNVIQRQVLDRVCNSKFFGSMIDKSTDISVQDHLVVFLIFLEVDLPISCLLGLLSIEDGKEDSKVIFKIVMLAINNWRLDMAKFLIDK